ncbi:hypothetical protein BGZ94_004045 [Podila epigama]|nr:hypothetical protein BGZ94_004045 [Podila epigama]
MKFATSLPCVALLVAFATAQEGAGTGSSECITCLQTSLSAVSLCQGVNVTGVFGEYNATGSPALAKCLCSAKDGAWVDNCTPDTKCGSDIVAFKNTFGQYLEQSGLVCNSSTPTFVPPPPDVDEPSPTQPAGGAQTTDSAGQKQQPALFTQIIGFSTIAAVAITMSFF